MFLLVKERGGFLNIPYIIDQHPLRSSHFIYQENKTLSSEGMTN